VLRCADNRSEYIRSLLVFALDHKENTGTSASEHKENTTDYRENTDLIEVLKQDIEHLRNQNVDLTKLLNQEQSLHLQTQRQLMPGQEEIVKKNWWQFWK
jgi:cell shape-determining protein MreC